MTTATSGGSGEIEAKAETVRPWISSPARMVTTVTPAGKKRRASRKCLGGDRHGARSYGGPDRPPRPRRPGPQDRAWSAARGGRSGSRARAVDARRRGCRSGRTRRGRRRCASSRLVQSAFIATTPAGGKASATSARLEHQPLVDLAGEAPVGGDVDEDGAPSAASASARAAVPGLPGDAGRFGAAPERARVGGARLRADAAQHRGAAARTSRPWPRRRRAGALAAVAQPGEQRERPGARSGPARALGRDLAGQDVEEPDRGAGEQEAHRHLEGLHPGARPRQQAHGAGRAPRAAGRGGPCRGRPR